MGKLKEIFDILILYRLHSKYYPKLAFFFLFSLVIGLFSRYVVTNKITSPKAIVLILFILSFIVVPLGSIYYAIRCGISVYKISKNQFDHNYTNQQIWLSDITYILLTLYIFIVNYIPKMALPF